MTITLYQAQMSSSSPIVWAMAELGLEYENVPVDLQANEQKEASFLALNPMGQVPTLVVDGQPMFESTAILFFLGDTHGVERGLWPASGSPERMIALTWVCWSATTLGGVLRQVFGNNPETNPESHSPAQLASALEQFGNLATIFDNHFRDRDYVTGENFSLADCYCAAIMWWANQVVPQGSEARANIAAWRERCIARPAARSMGV